MKNLLVLIFFITMKTSAQVGIDTLMVTQVGAIQHDQLKFPVVITGNEDVDALINNDLKNRFTGNEYPHLNADSALLKWSNGQLFSLGFEVTYNRNELLSINVSAESCGAHCNGWTDYFNYSTVTGKLLSLGEIADTSGKFKQTVIEDKNRQFGTAREQLEKLFPGKTSGPDADDYKLLLQYYNNCDESFTLQSYALYSDHLEIIAQCYLPNVFKSMMPSIKLRYPYSAVKKHLKVKLL